MLYPFAQVPTNVVEDERMCNGGSDNFTRWNLDVLSGS